MRKYITSSICLIVYAVESTWESESLYCTGIGIDNHISGIMAGDHDDRVM